MVDRGQDLGHGSETQPGFVPIPTERGSQRWNIRRILTWGAVGAVGVPVGALLLTTLLGNDFMPSSAEETVALTKIIGLQVLLGGILGVCFEIKNQQRQRKRLASS